MVLHTTLTSIATIKARNNEPVLKYVETDKTPDKVNTEPDDKSNIPEITNIVWPNAKIVLTDI